MGGMRGYVRGKTKIATWLKFKRKLRRDPEPFGLHLEWPANKHHAYQEMKRDLETGEWVLEYHFGK